MSYATEKSSTLIDNGVFYLGMLVLVWVGGIYNWQGWLSGLDIGLPFVPLFILARQSNSKLVPLFVLALGLFKDVLGGTPFGFWGLLFITFYVLIYAMQRLVSVEGYREQWMSFALNIGIIYTIAFAIALGRQDITASPLAMIISALATCLFYPLIALLFRLTPAMIGEE
ncbi:MAG: hypothetical protein HAW65_02690 [Alphaproteobacteria bacterium]|nr:hypothetical protein [Alphaproteobacteria bacterium]MBE8220199.1 hypothetical protein [Alphaproteobacteria bacterium]